MGTLLKSVQIVAPGHKLNGAKRDILIERGKIKAIGTRVADDKAKVIKEKGLCVSPGWFDTCAFLADPGFEHKEDLNSGLNAAARGGFTAVMPMPTTDPVIDNKSGIEYLRTKAQNHLVDVIASGALSKGAKGSQIAEMIDMTQAGARTFTDYKRPVNNPELMNRALEYSKNFDGVISSFPFDNTLCPGGIWNEGEHSVSHGLKGIPAIAEEMRLSRDIDLLRYTGGRLHVLMISTAGSVDLVRKAKKEGLKITCGVSAHQLAFTDADINAFDTDRKVLPPFRSQKDVKALVKGLKDGTIDVICSDHNPQDIESKRCEFEHAEFGISSLETTFAAANKALSDQLNLEQIIEKMSTNPRLIFGVQQPVFEEGATADFTLFNPETEVSVSKSEMQSRSNNTPFDGALLLGKIVGVFSGSRQMEF